VKRERGRSGHHLEIDRVILLIASFPLLVLVIENASSLDVRAAVKNALAETAGTLDTLREIRGRICESFEESREIKRQTFNYFAFQRAECLISRSGTRTPPCRMTYRAFHHAARRTVMRSTKCNYNFQRFGVRMFFSALACASHQRLNALSRRASFAEDKNLWRS